MKNIWTRHLKRSNTEDSDKGTRFTKMLHSLVRTGVNTDDNEIIKASYVAETELNVWAAKSQKGHEIGLESLSQDHVRLLMAEDGRLFLRYDVAGESPFEITVKSENEAMQIIEEDNATTEQLYPQNPELKWIKM